MRILHIVPDIDPLSGGVTAYVMALVREQISRGDKPHILTLDQGGRTPPLTTLGLGLTALSSTRMKYRYSPGLHSWIREHARDFDYAIIHGLWQYHCYGSAIALREVGLPYYIFPHGMLDPWFKNTHPLKHLKKWCYWPWADFRALANARAVIFTTEAERIKARESFWLYSVREAVVSLGIEEPESHAEGAESFVGKYPTAQGYRLVLYLGRIHPKKGVDLLIQAFAQTLNEEFRLVLAGPCDEAYRSSLIAFARTLHVDHRIIWTGMLDDVAKAGALAAAEVFVLPSHSENFGVAVVEALAAKCPVIISNKVDIYDTIRGTKSGLVCRDTMEGLSEALAEWRDMTPFERERMRMNGRRCFEENFTIRRSADLLTTTLENPPTTRFRGWVPVVLYAFSLLLFLFLFCEIAVRLMGLTDQPLFLLDEQLGYVVAPSQSGAVLNQNRWEFNDLSMGTGPYEPTGHVNIVLAGDSIIFGGNPLDQSDKPAQQLESLAGGKVRVWPLATPGWHIGNEIEFLKRNDAVLQDADALVWELNSGDLEDKASWGGAELHPLSPPLCASWFLFDKYVKPYTWGRMFHPPQRVMAVETLDANLNKFSEFVKILRAKHPALVILIAWYPQSNELATGKASVITDCGFYERYGKSIESLAEPPMLSFVNISHEPEWNDKNYRDFIHQNASGSHAMALIFHRELKKALPTLP